MFGFLLLVALAVADETCENRLGLQQCYDALVVDADVRCAEDFCETCEFPHGCDLYCGKCAAYPLVRDCQGRTVPSAWIGDGFCDAQRYLFDSALVDLNCNEHQCDGGDCEAEDANGYLAPCEPAGTDDTIESIAAIQTREDRADDVVLFDYDCYRSKFFGASATVSGTITAVDASGFFLAERAEPWSALYVRTSSSSYVRSALGVGLRVEVRGGYVNERLGTTQLQVASNNEIVLLPLSSSSDFIEPLPVSVEDLGANPGFAPRLQELETDTSCRAAAEPYESVLVRFEDVEFSGRPTRDRRLAITTQEEGFDSPRVFLETADFEEEEDDPLAYFSKTAFDQDAKLERCTDVHDAATCDFTGVRLQTLTGVATEVTTCDFSKFTYFQCFSWSKLKFAFAVKPRTTADFQGLSLADDVLPVTTAAPSSTATVSVPEVKRVRNVAEIQARFREGATCHYPSNLENAYVEFEAFVTALDGFGFFAQDVAAYYAGIYVVDASFAKDDDDGITKNNATYAVGSRVRVAGIVAELRGQTTVEADVVSVLNSDDDKVTLEPLALSHSLGQYAAEGEACNVAEDVVNERYESVLVEATVEFVRRTDTKCGTCFDAIEFITSGSYAGLLDDHLFPDLRGELVGKERAKVRGIVRYAYVCEHAADPLYCLEGNAQFHFGFVLSPRVGDVDFVVDRDDDDPQSNDDDDHAAERPSATASEGGPSDPTKKSQDDPLTLVVLVGIMALLVGLLAAMCVVHNRRAPSSSSSHHAPSLFEIPMAEATEIQQAHCEVIDDDCPPGARGERRLPSARITPEAPVSAVPANDDVLHVSSSSSSSAAPRRESSRRANNNNNNNNSDARRTTQQQQQHPSSSSSSSSRADPPREEEEEEDVAPPEDDDVDEEHHRQHSPRS